MDINGLRNLIESDIVAKFRSKNGLSCRFGTDRIYLFNYSIIFLIYVHLGTLYLDVLFPLSQQWGWDIDSLIQESLPNCNYDAWQHKIDSGAVSVDGLSKQQVIGFLASILIVDSEMQDILSGDTARCSKVLQPMTAKQLQEVAQLLSK